MKRLLAAAALVPLAGASFATQFVTLSYGAHDGTGAPDLGPTFVASGNTYSLNFSNFTIANQPYVDVQWTHSFDTTVATAGSPATAPYTSVTQVVSGLVRRASGTGTVSVSSILSESILASNGTTVATASGTRTFTQANVGTVFVPFTLTLTTPFSRSLASGFAVKDDLFINTNDGSVVQISSISQQYTPVPEPASMAALGLGALALLRRRRKA